MGRCEKPGQPQLPGTQSHNGKLRLTPCRFELLWDATNYHEMLLVTLGSSELPRTTLTYSENSELPWKAPSHVGKLNVTLINKSLASYPEKFQSSSQLPLALFNIHVHPM